MEAVEEAGNAILDAFALFLRELALGLPLRTFLTPPMWSATEREPARFASCSGWWRLHIAIWSWAR